MKKNFLFIIIIFSVSSVNAQSKSINSESYTTALGVKIWDGGGISLKHFLSSNKAGELIGYFWNRGFRLTGLYEIHGNIENAGGLKWYIGPGAHIGFYDYKTGSKTINGTYIGVDGVIGLDFKIRSAPINISIDWQPTFEFGTNLGFLGSWGGLGVRYTF